MAELINITAEARANRELWAVLRDTTDAMVTKHGAVINADLIVGYNVKADSSDATEGAWRVSMAPTCTFAEVSTPTMTVAPDSAEGLRELRKVVRHALAYQWAAE
jgi:hypothetical protein